MRPQAGKSSNSAAGSPAPPTPQPQPSPLTRKRTRQQRDPSPEQQVAVTPAKCPRRSNATANAAKPKTPTPRKTSVRRSRHEGHENGEQVGNGDAVDPVFTDPLRNDEEHIGAGRSYFESHRGAVKTNNFTLADLNLYPPEELAAALERYPDPLAGQQQKAATDFSCRFDELEFLLSAGHSLLLHGYGSKRAILDHFAQHLSYSGYVYVINGYHPNTSLRRSLAEITREILDIKSHPKRILLDYVDAIHKELSGKPLHVIIHNIDGAALRPAEVQTALSKLAAHTNIRMVASVDHVNAPLLWDTAAYAAFRWLWVQCDTLVPYDAETLFSTKPLLRGNSDTRVQGAIALLKSLSSKARAVFRELATRRADAEDDGDADGQQVRMTFNELFAKSQQKFLVSDTASLRMILKELDTHDLLQTRRGADAVEEMWIPLSKEKLKKILNEVDVME